MKVFSGEELEDLTFRKPCIKLDGVIDRELATQLFNLNDYEVFIIYPEGSVVRVIQAVELKVEFTRHLGPTLFGFRRVGVGAANSESRLLA